MGDSDAGDAAHRNSGGWRSGAASIAIGVSIALIAGVAIRTSVNWLYAPLVGAGIGYITYQIVTVVLRGRALRRKPALTAVDYEEGYKSLRGVMESLGDDTTPHLETAALLLDTERESFQRTYIGSDSLEAKATTLLGIVAGATSAFGVFGIAREGTRAVTTPIVVTAFAFVLMSMVALLYTLRAKPFTIPDLSVYLLTATVREDNRPALYLFIAARYRDMREELRRAIDPEPSALGIAYAAVAIAAALVVLNALDHPTSTKHSPTVAQHAPQQKLSAPAGATQKRRGNPPSPKPVH